MSDSNRQLDSPSASGPEVILTAADAEYFAGLKPLVACIRDGWNRYPIFCIDLGMESQQLCWLDEQSIGHIPVARIPGIPSLPGESEYIWKLWIKPFFFDAAPGNRVVWLDSDTVVLRNLHKLFELLEAGPVFTTTGNDHEPARNKPALYTKLPVAPHPVTSKFLNAGVMALDTNRDRELLTAWMFCARQGMEREEIRSLIRNNDQGSLLWALHKTNRLDRIDDSRVWNCLPNLPYRAPVPKIEELGKGRLRYPRETGELLARLREDHPHANVVHWCAYPKLWQLWL